MRELLIRHAGKQDLKQVKLLIKQLGYAVESGILAKKLTSFRASDNEFILLAEHAPRGKAVGLLVLHILELLHEEDHIGRISAIVVAPEHQHCGIGTAILRAGEKFLVERGCSRIEVISGSNRDIAHGFYRKNRYKTYQGKRFVKFLK